MGVLALAGDRLFPGIPLARSPRWPRSRGRAACYDGKEHKEILQTLVPEQHPLVEKTGQTLKDQHLLGNPFVETPIDHYAGRGTSPRE